MTKADKEIIPFSNCKGKKVEAEFSGGDVSSDGGSILLRQVDDKLSLLSDVAKKIMDQRRQASCIHDYESLLRQRVFGLCLGYEDNNDHKDLRLDPAIQTALGKDTDLASESTLSRFENSSDCEVAWAIHQIFFDKFVASFDSPPEELILDFDATDDLVHGNQEGYFYHGYYDHYCFLPLYVFCGNQLLVSYLRPSNIDGAKHTGAILNLLVKHLRAVWPDVRILFRADSGFCRPKILNWCERKGVDYIIGLPKNKRLQAEASSLIKQSADDFKTTNKKQRLFGEFDYAAGTWPKERHVIIKAEHNSKGPNTRYVVTNLSGDPQYLYDKIYCQRGAMENRIKEQQLDLFADRTSCHKWWSNQFRLLLSSLAYVLMDSIRRLGLVGTELENACCNTIRLKLLKIGVIILRNTRRVRFLLSSSYPFKALFKIVSLCLNAV
ncbi:IS1380 family transposase [bacterium]|nr:IS1380 family transposase [bacterium]